ncbi:uncharacterized protein PGTG_20610 [Puccinia graminis f. sp. tritici CRL 75-36-700-3]|uniref:Uncharacterized protein n=2 Tax=Puccinia graminis f. sp. tritici TaxID=56615 RepID=H6QNU5_PUCGT|nr:uncharacterized protein PGTG_20610 [Puccinia graminis f. sp. tritici CRL 75-36-700-3]EHS62487.1 hypothetical protein PGTG_20610 [Puccinia graminis f. sp. tritici CRL 75-36-700-3]
MFLQGNATGAGANTTELARNQHPGLEEDVMDVTEGHEGNGSRGGVATSNLFGQVPEELMRRLSLDDDASSLVRQLSEVRPEDQWIVSIALLVANLSGAHLIQGEPARPREIAGAVEVVPGPFNYVQTIRTFLRRRIRDLLTVGNLEAYSRTHTTGGLPIASTPLVLLSRQLGDQPDDFKEDYLPPGWPDDEVANQSVLGLLRSLVKHERGSLRNLLLTNIKEFNHRAIDGPVPKLGDLILVIDRIMGSRDHLRPANQILGAYTSTMKVRLAYIRLEVVHHYLNPDPATNLSQWDIIDRRLEFLRRQSLNYKQAYARLIIKTDRELFGDFEFRDIPRDAIVLPSESQVQQEIGAANHVGPVGNGANETMVVDQDVFM